MFAPPAVVASALRLAAPPTFGRGGTGCYPIGTKFVVKSGTWVHSGPSISEPRVGRVHQGEEVTPLNKCPVGPGWWDIESGSVTGWVSKKHLTNPH
jgi:uncharacterized protein YgiM (DUF1202 family)